METLKIVVLFIHCGMPPIPLQAIIDDPLAGCSPIVQDEGNGTTILRGLLMRLRLFLDEKRSTAIGDQVVAEAQLVCINRWEYVINEIQYELRRCQKGYDDGFEMLVLNNWTKDLLKRHTEDVVWEFFKQVRGSRERRKR